jgi:hypothetical protein
MTSEVVRTNVGSVTLFQNEYGSGDTVTLKYRHGATREDCLAAEWQVYYGWFESLGFVQVQVESTL